ncbi:hypothetical protein HJA82_01950 [Rhizobium bangladeshense]|uniref:hypothetical protein n=1 Tax=Rhizobium TaxID=379 RepID=UPI001C838347|nr:MULTISPECIES: hypothetical protein [Rhizobium]MBX4906149.1 hypothetical protein [Rhizobium bangladeshense]MBX5213007.1 hypothetical protein [Rhizobium sp. NLR9a]MBX5239322.1 hypothetical protein [Rhizobium sp. NLR22b]
MKPAADPGGGAMKHVANFDLQITDDIRICGMRLLMAPDGRLLTYAPTALGGRRSVTFSPETTAAITDAARNSYLELVTADDRSSTAAA